MAQRSEQASKLEALREENARLQALLGPGGGRGAGGGARGAELPGAEPAPAPGGGGGGGGGAGAGAGAVGEAAAKERPPWKPAKAAQRRAEKTRLAELATLPGAGPVPGWGDRFLLGVSPRESWEFVGKGGYSRVYRARWMGAEVALKEASRDAERAESSLGALLREWEHLENLRHPNIVQLFGACRIDGRLYLVTEFLPHCLRDRVTVQALRRQENRNPGGPCAALADVARALTYLHSQGVLHRDVKARNIMLTGDLGTAKLIDFGLAVRWDDSDRDQLKKAGTKKYRAPEVDGHSWYGGGCDTFSLGITLARVARECLWQEDKERTCAMEGTSSEPPPTGQRVGWRPERGSVETQPWYALAKECVKLSPKQRPTASECLERLRAMSVSETFLCGSGGPGPADTYHHNLQALRGVTADPYLDDELSRQLPFAMDREAFIRRAPVITSGALSSFCERMDFSLPTPPGAQCPDPAEDIIFQVSLVGEKKEKEGREHKRLRSPGGDAGAVWVERRHRPSRKKLQRLRSPGKAREDSPVQMDAAS